MNTFIRDKKIRNSQEFVDFVVKYKRLPMKVIAQLASDKFDIRVSQNYIAKLTLKLGLRKLGLRKPRNRPIEMHSVQISGDYTMLELPSDLIKKMCSQNG